MIIRTLALYDRFKCAGSACKDTCCVRDKLVLDNKTYFEYQRVISKGDAFGRRMVASISERNGVASFRMRENGECPFLLRNRLCELQIRLGADKICETCRKYPVFSKEYGNYREIGCSFSCPEVLRLVLTHPERFEVRERENDTEPVTFDDLDAGLLEALYPVRDRILQIAQDSRNPLLLTATILLRLASEVQDAIDRKNYEKPATLIAPFAGDDPTGGITGEDAADPTLREELIARLLKLYCKLEYKKDDSALRLERAYQLFKSETPEERVARERDFGSFIREREYEYRKWLFYILHRDLLDAVRDGKFYPRMRYAVVTTLCLFEFGSLEWKSRGKFPPQRQEDLFRNYSREIDENPRNLARFMKKLNGSAFALPKLLRVFACPTEKGEPAPGAAAE